MLTKFVAFVALLLASSAASAGFVIFGTSVPTPPPVAPTVQLTSPAANCGGPACSGIITITATCSANCTEVDLQVDHATITGGQCLGTNVTSCSVTNYDTTPLSNSNHTVRAIGINAGGTTTLGDTSLAVNNPIAVTQTGVIYYITTGGSDSNNGLSKTSGSGCPSGSTGTCGPWQTPNHTLNCSVTGGDTILVEPGTYSNGQFYNDFGAAGTGCSGHGVFRTLKCDGTTLGGSGTSCILNDANMGPQLYLLGVQTPYWIIQGFQGYSIYPIGDQGGNNYNTFGFVVIANSAGACGWPPVAACNGHDIVFVNNWPHHLDSAGFSLGDYSAVVGTVNVNNGGQLTNSMIDAYEPYPIDTNAGTHIFVAGAFVLLGTPTNQDTDNEGIIWDDFAWNQKNGIYTNPVPTPYVATVAAVQSMFIGNASWAVESYQEVANSQFYYLYSTTTYGNSQNHEGSGCCVGELIGNGAPMVIDHVIAVGTAATNTGYNVIQFTGSVSGTTLTVHEPCCDSSFLSPNCVLSGTGISTTTPPHVIAQLTNTNTVYSGGRGGTYTLDQNLGTVPASGTETMYCAGLGGAQFQPNFGMCTWYGASAGTTAQRTVTNSTFYNTANPSPVSANTYCGGFTLGSNVQNGVNPNFAAPAIPSSEPDCSSYATTTACAQGISLVANFVANQTSGSPGTNTQGYQPPGSCGTDPGNAVWPAWVQPALLPPNLVTTPCFPIVTAGFSQSYTIGNAAVALDPTLTITAGSTSTLSSAAVVIASGFQNTDTLNFTNQSGITGAYNSTAGQLILTGSATIAAYQTALQSVTFSTNATAGTRTLAWNVVE